MLRAWAHLETYGACISNRNRTMEAMRFASNIEESSSSLASISSCNLWLHPSIKYCKHHLLKWDMLQHECGKSFNKKWKEKIRTVGTFLPKLFQYSTWFTKMITSTRAASFRGNAPTIAGDNPASLAPATNAASIQPTLVCNLPSSSNVLNMLLQTETSSKTKDYGSLVIENWGCGSFAC